jgi:hypothetical protein
VTEAAHSEKHRARRVTRSQQDHRLAPSGKRTSTPHSPPPPSAGHVFCRCRESRALPQHPTGALGVRLRPPSSHRRGPEALCPCRSPAALVVVQGIDASRELEWIKICPADPCKHRGGCCEQDDGAGEEDWYNPPGTGAKRPLCAAYQSPRKAWYAWDMHPEEWLG